MGQLLLTKLQPGKTYTVAVVAKDSDGNRSGKSLTYTFTTPTAKLDGTQLTSTNTTVVTALANDSACVVGGALTAGALDANGLIYAGRTNLASIWNSTSAGPVVSSSLTGTASAGAVIINSTGILGYQFSSASQNAGQANFLLNTLDGNAYFRGTIYAGGGQIGTGSTNVWYIGNYDYEGDTGHGVISSFLHNSTIEYPPFSKSGVELDSEGYLELYNPVGFIFNLLSASTATDGFSAVFVSNIATTSATYASGSTTITVSSSAGLSIRQKVYGTGINGSYITNISGASVTLSAATTASGSSRVVSFCHGFNIGDNPYISGFNTSGYNNQYLQVISTTSNTFTTTFNAILSQDLSGGSATYYPYTVGIAATGPDPYNTAPNGIYFTDIYGLYSTNIGAKGTIFIRGTTTYGTVSQSGITIEPDNATVNSLSDTGTFNIYANSTTSYSYPYFSGASASRMSIDNNTIQSTVYSGGTRVGTTLYINQFGGNIVLGYGTSSANNAYISSPAIRYNETVTTASKYPLYILQSGTPYIYTYTSHFKNKNNINSISKYSELSKEIPLEKVSEIRSYNPFKILNVSPVSFNSVLDTDNKDKLNIGFIVEDIAEKVPELSSINEDGEAGMYNLDGIVASMLAVIQDQQKTIEDLEQRLALLENK